MTSSKKKILLRVLVALVVGGAVAVVGWRLRREAIAARSEDPSTFHGNVDIRDVTLAFRVGGRVATVAKHEGDHVDAGEVIANLDTAPFEVALGQARAAVEVAEAELARVVAGSRQEDIAEARAVVAEHRAALRRAEDTRDRYVRLNRTGAVTDEALTDAQATAAQAHAALRAAEAALKRAIDGSRAEDIAVARAQVTQARAAMDTAQLNLDDTALKASTAGTVITRAIEPGTIVAPGTPALVVSFDDPVWIRAFATERQLASIAPGTPVEVIIDAHPDRPYRGQVGYVSPQSEFTPKNVETAELRTSLVYRFRVVVSSHDGGLRQGMPVTVRLVASEGEASSEDPGATTAHGG